MLIRSLDTRLFIDYTKDYMLREFTVKEATYEEIEKKGFKFSSEFNNNEQQADIIQQFLITKQTIREKVSIKKK